MKQTLLILMAVALGGCLCLIGNREHVWDCSYCGVTNKQDIVFLHSADGLLCEKCDTSVLWGREERQINTNKTNIAKLRVGMTTDQVLGIMGPVKDYRSRRPSRLPVVQVGDQWPEGELRKGTVVKPKEPAGADNPVDAFIGRYDQRAEEVVAIWFYHTKSYPRTRAEQEAQREAQREAEREERERIWEPEEKMIALLREGKITLRDLFPEGGVQEKTFDELGLTSEADLINMLVGYKELLVWTALSNWQDRRELNHYYTWVCIIDGKLKGWGRNFYDDTIKIRKEIIRK